MESCNLCENPYPYMCAECCAVMDKEDMEPQCISVVEKKKYIGSGEDLILEMLEDDFNYYSL